MGTFITAYHVLQGATEFEIHDYLANSVAKSTDDTTCYVDRSRELALVKALFAKKWSRGSTHFPSSRGFLHRLGTMRFLIWLAAPSDIQLKPVVLSGPSVLRMAISVPRIIWMVWFKPKTRLPRWMLGLRRAACCFSVGAAIQASPE